jgi:hypothetical protein
MKKSEELRIRAGEIDSDIAYLAAANKIMREERKERFEDKWLQLLLAKTNVCHNKEMERYEIWHQKFRTIDFYPKSNKVLIRKDNKWCTNGLNWLIKNFELR